MTSELQRPFIGQERRYAQLSELACRTAEGSRVGSKAYMGGTIQGDLSRMPLASKPDLAGLLNAKTSKDGKDLPKDFKDADGSGLKREIYEFKTGNSRPPVEFLGPHVKESDKPAVFFASRPII